MSRILILGNSGWIGAKLQFFFQNREGFKLYDSKTSTPEQINLAIETFVPEIIINCVRTNDINQILNNLRKCKDLNIFFIHLGSSAEYGSFDLVKEEDSFFEPQSLYGKTKLSETLTISSILESQSFLNLKLFNLVGRSQPTHTALGEILSKIKFLNSNPFTLNDFDIIRDYVTVDDLCRFIEFAILSKFSGIYNFGSGTGINLLEIVELICKDFDVDCLLGELNSYRIKSVVANNTKLLETGFKITPLSPSIISRIIL